MFIEFILLDKSEVITNINNIVLRKTDYGLFAYIDGAKRELSEETFNKLKKVMYASK